MSKTLFTLVLPEPKVRKKQAPTAKAHKDQHAYSRKRKHKQAHDADAWRGDGGAPEHSGAFFMARPAGCFVREHPVDCFIRNTWRFFS